MFLATHIGKAGGSSFREVLFQLFGQKRVLTDHSPRWLFRNGHKRIPDDIKSPKVWVPKIKQRGVLCICGHEAKYKKWIDYYPDLTAVAWIRDPVDRIISQYFYEARIENWKNQSWPPNVVDLIDYAERFPSLQPNYWIPLDIVDQYDFIGLIEHYNEHFQIFCQRFANDKKLLLPRLNINPIMTTYPISKRLRSRLEKINDIGMELYTHVQEKWRFGDYED
jgi:hypothetical protein